MPWLRVEVPADDLRPGLERIRARAHVPHAFPAAAEAEAAVGRGPVDPAAAPRRDARDLALFTIDPPRSRDLDQAFSAETRPGGGYRVHYAIADLAAFVRPGGAVDREAWQRGLTLYLPGARAPLHPPVIAEDAASLLPGRDRPSNLWTIDLDAAGEVTDARLEPAVVRSRRQMTYAEAQSALDEDHAEEPLRLLREIGRLRQEREAARGGISLNLPARELVPAPKGGYKFAFEAPLPVEGWNAQISLLAGHSAARIMVDGGAGILRTLPPVDEERVARLRVVAHALGVEWDAREPLAEVVRREWGATPASATFLTQVTHALRGASYEVVAPGEEPAPHGGLAMIYSHVTAPLRRLADRYAGAMVVALCAGRPAPEWAEEALPRLPETMAEADRRSDRIEGEVLNLAEAVVMEPHVGETFAATVIDVGRERATVQLHEPPVIEKIPPDGREIGQRVDVKLLGADTVEGRLELEVIRAPTGG